MLQTFDHESADSEFLVTGAIVGDLYEYGEYADTTSILTEYIELAHFPFKADTDSCENAAELKLVRNNVDAFKKKRVACIYTLLKLNNDKTKVARSWLPCGHYEPNQQRTFLTCKA